MNNPFAKMAILIGAFTLLGTLVTSCAVSERSSESNGKKFPDDPRVDRSFITGQPCEAPCWYNLRLGEATVDDIRATLTKLPLIDQSTVFEGSIGTDGAKLGFYFDCVYYNPPGSCGNLVAENGRLSEVVLSVQYPLTLESVIERLGIPKFYTVDTSSTESNCILSIYWPEKSIVAVVEENSREFHCAGDKNEPIELSLQVVSLVYSNISAQYEQNYETRPWPTAVP